MRVLYTETLAYYPTSAHFLEPLQAMAASGRVEFDFIDEAKYVASEKITNRVARRVMGRPLSGYREINQAMLAAAGRLRPDVVLIGKGAYFAAATLRALKAATGATLVNYAADDPFNRANSSRDVLESIPLFDLYVCTRRAMMADVQRAGCPRTAFVMFGYKPEVHFPEPPANAAELERFESDVVFIGGCDADRAPFFEHLVRAMPQARIHFYGGYFNRYAALKPYWRGFVAGSEYRKALSGTKIALNLVRRANRDDHVMRTFEVPACGAFMLAERTPTHTSLFAEDQEAAFFESPQEMAAKVRGWLERDVDRAKVAAAGRRKILAGRHTYADRLEEILELAARERITADQAEPPRGSLN